MNKKLHIYHTVTVSVNGNYMLHACRRRRTAVVPTMQGPRWRRPCSCVSRASSRPSPAAARNPSRLIL